MKKSLVFIIILCNLLGVAANAAIGDELRTLYTTDIVTYLNGKQIQGYSLDGRMMICLGDLKDYGYAVEYDDSIRTLFVTKDGEPSADFNPYFERGKVGSVAGHTYETDIQAYVNGKWVPTENIGGRLVTVAEDLADVYSMGNENLEFGTSPYFMTHVYDDESRTLNIYSTTGTLPSTEEQLNNLRNKRMPNGKEVYILYDKEELPIYDGGYLVYLGLGGAHNSTSMYINRSNIRVL